MIGHPEYHDLDGIHFNGKGVAAQAAQVAERIQAVLDEPGKPTSAGDDPKAR
jgi:lysophospholipase L1-like esterase